MVHSTQHVVYILLLVPIFALLASGCTAKGPQTTAGLEDILATHNMSNQEVKALNDKFFALGNPTLGIEDYKLCQGDLLQVTVFEAPELNMSARVAARGFITMPLLGSVEVKGLTVREAEQKIENHYREKYIHDPHVIVFVKEQQGGKVTVLGAVNKPGTYDCPSHRRLMEVLATAEGLSDRAGKIVQVKRTDKGADQPAAFIIEVDMEELVKNGKSESNLEIFDGDVVYVAEAGTIYVDGAVRKPGSYRIRESMTPQEAVVAAGGFSRTADKGKIKLVRCIGEGKREVIELDAKDLQDNAADSLELKDRDVIFVETSMLQALVYGLRLNLGTGVFGIGYTPSVP
jgi:polysaccharide export outer membrane protein